MPQVLWLDTGYSAWATTDSSDFYVDLALRSTDARFDGKRPRLQVRPAVACHAVTTYAVIRLHPPLHASLLVAHALISVLLWEGW